MITFIFCPLWSNESVGEELKQDTQESSLRLWEGDEGDLNLNGSCGYDVNFKAILMKITLDLQGGVHKKEMSRMTSKLLVCATRRIVGSITEGGH